MRQRYAQCRINHMAEAAYAAGPALLGAPRLLSSIFPRIFYSLLAVSVRGPKEPKSPRKREALNAFLYPVSVFQRGHQRAQGPQKTSGPRIKKSRPQRAGPQTVFLFPVSGRDPNSARPHRVHGPQKRNPKIKKPRQAPKFKKQRLQKQGRKQKMLYLLWGRGSKKLGQKIIGFRKFQNLQ